ncbi:biopolymer transport protein ExbB [Methylomarinovum caldicuralii]|uniref:Biopolymer transport protein ExbB n=1 Tax=Methylomarinovum caldicuralii TaxID=438856 RepID=A0AAU9C9F1_9GAMM|nr:MotA/TolQ/ExbB proton channel family protein [Methylomarinovum caldicuralii]BCX81109.1 biopolymer transport protein ExbB [Methylomarinovum caldicuralii]
MLEIIEAGGWLMWPILACSVLATAIVCERFWSLRTTRIIPPHLVTQVWRMFRQGELDANHIRQLQTSSPLGAILAAGLSNYRYGREVMKEAIEDVGRQVAHELERFLDLLGTIASVTPLLGLLGTVMGMIKVFSAITAVGVGDPKVLAGGISEALITTAAGLSVAIPSLIFYRHFQAKVQDLVLKMENEALRFIDIMYSETDHEEPKGE